MGTVGATAGDLGRAQPVRPGQPAARHSPVRLVRRRVPGPVRRAWCSVRRPGGVPVRRVACFRRARRRARARPHHRLLRRRYAHLAVLAGEPAPVIPAAHASATPSVTVAQYGDTDERTGDHARRAATRRRRAHHARFLARLLPRHLVTEVRGTLARTARGAAMPALDAVAHRPGAAHDRDGARLRAPPRRGRPAAVLLHRGQPGRRLRRRYGGWCPDRPGGAGRPHGPLPRDSGGPGAGRHPRRQPTAGPARAIGAVRSAGCQVSDSLIAETTDLHSGRPPPASAASGIAAGNARAGHPACRVTISGRWPSRSGVYSSVVSVAPMRSLPAGLRLVLLDDRTRDAPARRDVEPFALRPLADRLILFPAATGSTAPTGPAAAGGTARPRDSARRAHELVERRAERLGVLLGEVDLVERAVEPELHGLIGGAAVEVVNQVHFYLACHGFWPSSVLPQ